MTTKAELEAEVAALRHAIEERDKVLETNAREDDEKANSPAADDVHEGAQRSSSMIEDALKQYGIEPDDLDAIWEKLSVELNHLPRDKPILTHAVAFALGFILGRMTK